MEYNSKISKKIKEDEKKCPYCNSSNLKEYLYGMPSYDYDQEKYVLGGCEIVLNEPRPQYKCFNCGKDIYVETMSLPSVNIFGTNSLNLKPKYDGRDYIILKYRNDNDNYFIQLCRSESMRTGMKDIHCTITLEKTQLDSVYKIDDVQSLEESYFYKYYDIFKQITSNWIEEFENNKLIDDINTYDWALEICTKDDNISFSERKVPRNMNEFKNIILELEELYKEQFQKQRERKKNIINSMYDEKRG